MESSPVRILVVDDYEPWRVFICTTLQARANVRLHEATDGLEAIHKAQELRPDLILLDISLPNVNGLHAARLIREGLSHQKVLFVTEDRSLDIAEEALDAGASGFLVKSDAARQLMSAVDSVLEGRCFISSSLTGSLFHASSEHPDKIDRHELAIYTDDAAFVGGFAKFISTALKCDGAVIAVVTEAHGADILKRLKADGLNLDDCIDRGKYIPLSVADTLPLLMRHDEPDRNYCTTVFRDLVARVRNAAGQASSCIVTCGEIAPTLLAQGNAEGAIRLERLWGEMTKTYGASTFCGYLQDAFFPMAKDKSVFESICAEHSA